MMQVNKRFVVYFLWILLVLPLVGLNSIHSPAQADDTINYRLKWLFNASVAGDIYAAEQGIFAQHGLEVKVKQGGPERNAIRELELGHAQFGVASADQVIRALAKGADLVVLAQLFQVNPLQWMYRYPDHQIKSLADLRGKRVGITFGGNDETIMRTLLKKANVKEGDLSIRSVRYDYTPFYQKKVDLWPVYRNAQAPVIREKLARSGEELHFFDPSDFGVRFVANSLVTSGKMMKKSPQVVERFTTALLEGWTQALALDNEQTTLDLLARFDKETDAGIQKQQLDLTRSMILPPGIRMGTINIQDWKDTEQIMLTEKLIAQPVHVERILAPNNTK